MKKKANLAEKFMKKQKREWNALAKRANIPKEIVDKVKVRMNKPTVQ